MPTVATATATATATTAKRPPSRLDLAFSIYSLLRKEKTPPMARYCVLLALARSGQPMTAHHIGLAIGETTGPSGTIDSTLRAGLLAAGPACATSRQGTTYTLTSAGIAEVNRLMNPPPVSL